MNIYFSQFLFWYFCLFREAQGATGGPDSSELDTKDKKSSEDQNIQQPPSPNALKVAAAECLNSWINYLQVCRFKCWINQY